MDVPICNSSCVQPAHIAASLHQNQQLQRCWDRENLSQLHPSPSPVPVLGLACSRGSMVPPQVGPSQPQPLTKSYLYHQSPAEPDRPTQCTGKLSPSPDLPRELTAADAEYMNEEIWEETCRLEETRGQTLRADSRELLDEALQQDGRETAGSPVQQQLRPAAEMRQEQQWSRPTQTLRDHRDGRVRDPRSNVKITYHYSIISADTATMLTILGLGKSCHSKIHRITDVRQTSKRKCEYAAVITTLRACITDGTLFVRCC